MGGETCQVPGSWRVVRGRLGKVALTHALTFRRGLPRGLDGFMGGFDTSSLATVLPAAVLASVGAFFTALFRKGSTTRSLAVAWPQTMGTVLSATVQVAQRGNMRQEAPLVLYAYQVDGRCSRGIGCERPTIRAAFASSMPIAAPQTPLPATHPVHPSSSITTR